MADRVGSMIERTFTLRLPLDMRLTLGPLRRGRNDPCMRIDASEALRATRTPDGPATIHLRSRASEVSAKAWGPGAAWALDNAPELLGADDDPRGFTPEHPALEDLHRNHPGLRIGRSSNVVEVLIPTILEQKVTGKEARRSYERIVRRHGDPAPGPGGLWVPPTPAYLASLPSWTWHELGVERRRAETIRLACSYAGRLEETVTMSFESAHKRLTSLPGIGDWTAAHTTMAALGHADAVMVGDFHLPHLVAWVLARETRGSDERMLELLEPYRGQRGRVIRLIDAAGDRPARVAPRRALRAIERI